MIKFVFSFDESLDNLCGFDLGHIDILYDEKIISSRDRTPDQSMMLFPTVTDLLFGYSKLLLDKNSKEYACIGADSSFSMVFIKNRDNKVSINVNEELIYKTDKTSLAKVILDSSNCFINKYINKVPTNDPVVEDIMRAISYFKELL